MCFRISRHLKLLGALRHDCESDVVRPLRFSFHDHTRTQLRLASTAITMASAFAGAGSMAGTQPRSAPLGLDSKSAGDSWSSATLKEYIAAYAQYDPKAPLIDEPKLLFDDCIIFPTGTRCVPAGPGFRDAPSRRKLRAPARRCGAHEQVPECAIPNTPLAAACRRTHTASCEATSWF